MKHVSIVKIFTVISLAVTPLVCVAAMSSTHYVIYSDSVGLGGGLSSSTTYAVEQSIANPSDAAYATSSSYVLQAGYQSAVWNSITLNISPSTIDLGTLSTSAVNSGQVTATVSTDAPTGYSLSVESVSGSMPQAVVGGSVIAGTESYGLAVTGAHRSFTDDEAVTQGLVIASSNIAAVGDSTIMIFKASMSSNSIAGTYNQTVNVIVSAQF